MDPEALAELRQKYETIRAMRLRHQSGDEDADAVRREMRALAGRYPGALRELDELRMEVIEERLGALERALAGAPVPVWAEILSRYHAFMRVALEIKRRFARGAEADVHEWLRSGYQPKVGEPSPEELIEASGAILRPPDGRLSAWALAHVGAQLGISDTDVRRALSPHPEPRLEMLEEN